MSNILDWLLEVKVSPPFSERYRQTCQEWQQPLAQAAVTELSQEWF